MKKKSNKSKEEKKDLAYWLTKTPQERLQALQQMRQDHIDKYYNGVWPPFQRVVKIFKRK